MNMGSVEKSTVEQCFLLTKFVFTGVISDTSICRTC